MRSFTKLIIILFLSAASFNSQAKGLDTLSLDLRAGTIHIGKKEITKKTTEKNIVAMLGEPDRREKEGRMLVYDKLGVSFDMGRNQAERKVEGMYITYVYDNDLKVAKEKFNGLLLINGKTAGNTTSWAQMLEINPGMIDAGHLVLTNMQEQVPVVMMIHYAEGLNEIRQIMVGFSRQ
jgi:hypothetical protein